MNEPKEDYQEILLQRRESAELIPRMRKVLQKYWGPLTKNELIQLEREARLDLHLADQRRTQQEMMTAMKTTSPRNQKRNFVVSSSPTAIPLPSTSLAEEQLEIEEEKIQNSCILRAMEDTGGLWKYRSRISPHFLYISSIVSMCVGLSYGFSLAGPSKYCQNSIRAIAFFNCIAAIYTTLLRPNIVPFSNFVGVTVEICMAVASFIAAAFVAEGTGGKELAITVQLLCAKSATYGGFIELGIALFRVLSLKPFKLEIVPRVEVFRRVRDDLDEVSLIVGSAVGLGVMMEMMGV